MAFKLTRVLGLIAVFIVISWGGLAQGVKEDVESGKIPLPSDAQPLEIPLPKVGAAASGTVYYKTSLNKSQLIDFYSRQLSRSGWADKENALDALNKFNAPFPQKQKGIDVKGLLKNMIYFHKNDQTLMLMVIPPRGRHTATIFTLSYIGGGAWGQNFNLQPQAEELPASIPVYPGAQFISRVLKSRIYSANADIAAAVDFYRQKMPIQGWVLENQTPVSSKKMEIPFELQNNPLCKDCPKPDNIPEEVASELKKGVFMLDAGLDFTKDNGQRCKIDFRQMQSSALPLRTQITIIHEE